MVVIWVAWTGLLAALLLLALVGAARSTRGPRSVGPGRRRCLQVACWALFGGGWRL